MCCWKMFDVRPYYRKWFLFLAATKQLYEWYFPSVCLSVCHNFLIMFSSSYHHEIFRSDYQRSKVKVTEVTAQLNRFRIVTPV